MLNGQVKDCSKMTQITDFVQLRGDGKVVPSSMSVQEMLAQGWGPATVVGLRWMNGAKLVEIRSESGVHGIAVPGGDFVAAIFAGEQLKILNNDGAIVGQIPNLLRLPGGIEVGAFGWFEPAMTPADSSVVCRNRFGAAFLSALGTFRCDIDAQSMAVVAISQMR